MIITLTGNLLAERTFEYDQWSPAKTQRARAESFQVGGKGINVTRMLTRISCPTTAWCFAGGAPGDECLGWLRARGVPHRNFSHPVPTRTGLVVRSPERSETTFLGPDRRIAAGALSACAAALDEERDDTHHLALCGSFPGWDEPEVGPLRDALARWIDMAAFSADTYGPPLAWLVQRPVPLLKINRQEFDTLFASEPARVEERVSAALERWPVRAWIVTDGPNPVCYGSVDTPVALLSPPPVSEVSATGSGDVLFACVLHALHVRKLGLADAVRYALPYASANAAHPGVAEFDLNNLPHERSVHP